MTVTICGTSIYKRGSSRTAWNIRWIGAKGACSSFGTTNFYLNSSNTAPRYYIGSAVKTDFIYQGVHYNRDGTLYEADEPTEPEQILPNIDGPQLHSVPDAGPGGAETLTLTEPTQKPKGFNVGWLMVGGLIIVAIILLFKRR